MANLTARFGVIVANIHAATLIDLAPDIEDRLAPRGWLALSVLSPAQTSRMAAAYRQVKVVATPTEDDWAAIVAARE